MTFLAPERKLRSIRLEAQRLQRRGFASPRQLATFLGRVNFLSQALQHASLFTRSLHRVKNRALRDCPASWDRKVPLEEDALQNLSFWIEECHFWAGKPIQLRMPESILQVSEVLETDASPTGWGAVLRRRDGHTVRTFGHWNAEEHAMSSNWKELKAVQLAMQALVPPGTEVLLRSDNKVAVSYVKKEGGRFPHLNRLALDIWRRAMRCQISLEVEHLPGALNTEADELSRKPFSRQDWRLHPEVFQGIVRWLGRTPEIDLFATRNNCQVAQFYSWLPDPEAAGIDAFRQDWRQHELAYANPPFAVLHRVIEKIKREKARVALVAPVWPSAPWFPILTSISSDHLLLPEWDNLFLPVSRQHQWHVAAPRWRCAVWLC